MPIMIKRKLRDRRKDSRRELRFGRDLAKLGPLLQHLGLEVNSKTVPEPWKKIRLRTIEIIRTGDDILMGLMREMVVQALWSDGILAPNAN